MKFKQYFLFSIFCAFFLALAFYVSGAVVDGNIIYYTFDDTDITGTNVLDLAGENNATITNAVSGATGKINQAIAFDGLGDTVVSNFDTGLSGDDDFSLNCWFYDNRTVDTAENYVFYGVGNDDDACALGYLTHNVGNDDKFYGHLRGGCGNGDFSSNEFIPYNEWFMVTWVHNSTDDFWYLYINGVINDTYDLGFNINFNAHPLWIGASDDAITWDSFNGTIDECGLWNRTILDTEVSELYNSGSGLSYPFAGGTPPDTTPPSISNVNQTPLNITNLNVMGSMINITVDIIDSVFLDESTIFINVTLNNTDIFINGTRKDSNFTKNFTSNMSNNYLFRIDEEDFLSGTYNINPEIMENTDHFNDTLISNNQWLKIKFFNVSNNKSQVFTEIMDENMTGLEDTAQYYYCNSTYSSGNPVSSDYCRLFAETSNKGGFNHTHEGGKSKHKIIPMGIDITDGTLNGLLVSSTIFILKRGNTVGERYFYISNVTRIDQVQTSNNNGNAWSNLVGTVDAHIHQFGVNESINYNICASDNSSNKACSGMFGDIIDLTIFSPNAITIFNPVEDSYNTTIIINHSVSGSASGQSITGYKYEYKKTSSHIWLLIIDNNFPFTNLVWDISNILNGAYHIKITVIDDLNLTSETISENFLIANDLTVSEQLLTEQNVLLTNIWEMIKMLGIYFLIITFLVIGVKVNYLMWGVSSILFWLLVILDGLNGTFNQNLALNITYILLGVLVAFGGVVMELGKGTKEEKKDMYEDFY